MPPKRTKKVPEIAAETPETVPPENVPPKPRAPKKAKAAAVSTETSQEDDKRGRKPRGGKIVLKSTTAAPPQPQ